MNFFKRRQDNRRKKPRPEGRVANFWQGVVSLVFYCILNDAAGGDDEREVVNEPSAGTNSANASSAQHFTLDTLADHRKTNHEPNPCLTSLSSSRAHSLSVGRLKEGKKDGETNTPSEKKKNWFSWFKKGSNKNKVTEEPEKKNDDESAKSADTSTKPVQTSLSGSSFKILQLTASPGGARKAYTNRLCQQPVRKAEETHEKVYPSVDDVHLDKKSLDGNKNDTLKTFSLSDVSSFGASEMSDSSSASFTEVTSLSSGEISDCWGLSDGQLPPSISSSSTDSFTDDGEDHIQVHRTPAVVGPMSASSDGSESDDTPFGTHGLESKEIRSTCSSGSAATSGDICNSNNIEVPGDTPNAAVDKETQSSSSDSAAIPRDIVTSHTTYIEVPSDAPNTVETLGTSKRFGAVQGETITDVYALIVRTLNLGLRKSTDPVPRDTFDAHDDKSVSTEPHRRPSTTAGLKDTKTQCNDVEEVERASEVPEHSTSSLHKLHTEWPQQHVNIEVLLGLKAPKNSCEALAVQEFREEEASDSANNASLKSGAVSTPTEKEQSSASIVEAKSEMAVDSGLGSRGDCMSSEP